MWAAAVLMVKRYGEDAMLEAAERADQLLDEGDIGLGVKPVAPGCSMCQDADP